MDIKVKILEWLRENTLLNNETVLGESNFNEYIIYPLQYSDSKNAAKQFDWDYANGVTKLVLIFEEFDFVIKIPFKQQEEYGYDYNTCSRSYSSEESASSYDIYDRYNILCGAGQEISGYKGAEWDYCAVEEYLYKRAVEEGLESCFLKTEKIGEVYGYPIYIQEKGKSYDCLPHARSYSREQYDSARDLSKRSEFPDDPSCAWILDFINYYDQDFYLKLGSFCGNYYIEDLHDGNVGYRNGAPVLIDYSSFYG